MFFGILHFSTIDELDFPEITFTQSMYVRHDSQIKFIEFAEQL